MQHSDSINQHQLPNSNHTKQARQNPTHTNHHSRHIHPDKLRLRTSRSKQSQRRLSLMDTNNRRPFNIKTFSKRHNSHNSHNPRPQRQQPDLLSNNCHYSRARKHANRLNSVDHLGHRQRCCTKWSIQCEL